MNNHAHPGNWGILALEVYVPDTCVHAQELEQADGVSPGKYTVGLGQVPYPSAADDLSSSLSTQDALAFCSPHEDPVSMALTATSRLLASYNIPPTSIGRLEVGTESNPDRSKSIKSHLMRLLAPANHDVQGTDCVHACYGGTAALLNALAWCSSCLWDGRLALVVASDVAAYAEGPARPTGGAAAVAMLIGPDAPLALVPGSVCSHFDAHSEFCKTHGLFPVFDGPATVQHYLTALDRTTLALRRRAATWCDALLPDKPAPSLPCNDAPPPPLLPHIDHAVFHAPYNKMVQKAWRRLQQLDSKGTSTPSTPSGASPADSPPGTSPLAVDAAETPRGSVLDDPSWQGAVAAGAHAQRLVGNCYCASVFVGLASLVEQQGAAGLDGQTVLVFSFGSGVASSVLLLRGRQTEWQFSLEAMASKLQLRARLAGRRAYPPAVMARCVEVLHQRYCGQWQQTVQCLEDGEEPAAPQHAWRIVELSDDGRAHYTCT